MPSSRKTANKTDCRTVSSWVKMTKSLRLLCNQLKIICRKTFRRGQLNYFDGKKQKSTLWQMVTLWVWVRCGSLGTVCLQLSVECFKGWSLVCLYGTIFSQLTSQSSQFTNGFRLKSTNPESITALDVRAHLVIIKALSKRKCGQRKGYVALTGSRWKRWKTELLCCFYSWAFNVQGVILRESSSKEKSVWGEIRFLSCQYFIAHSIIIGPFVMVDTYLSAPVEL